MIRHGCYSALLASYLELPDRCVLINTVLLPGLCSNALAFANASANAAFALAFDSVLLLLHDGYFVSWFRLE